MADARNVLFLDVDGVLNQCGLGQEVILDKAKLIRRIVEETGCAVVLSSTWRLYDELLDRVASLLSDSGVSIADCTPALETFERGLEIQAWLDENPEVTRFVILDDNSDMAHLVEHLVQTDSRVGLTDVLAEDVIRRLTAP